MGCVNSVPASVKETPSLENAPTDRPFGTFPRKNSVTRASASRRTSVSKKTMKESTAYSAAQFSVFLAHKGQQADVKDNLDDVTLNVLSNIDTNQPALDRPGSSAHARGSCALQLALLQSPKTSSALQRVPPHHALASPSCEDKDVVVLTIPLRARGRGRLSSGLCAPPPRTPANTAMGTPVGGKAAVVSNYASALASTSAADVLSASPSRDPSPSALAVDFVIRLAPHSPDTVSDVPGEWHWQSADVCACPCAEAGTRLPACAGRAVGWEEAKTDEAAEEREERRSMHSVQGEPSAAHTEGAARRAVQLASPPARQHRRVRVRMRMPTVRVVCSFCHEYEEAPVQDVRVRGASVAALEVASEHAHVREEDAMCLAAGAVQPVTPRTPLSTRSPAHAATPWSPALRVCAATPLPQPPAEGVLSNVACVAGTCDGEGALLHNLTRPGVVGLCAGAHASPRARYVWADCASVDIPAAVGALGGSSDRVYIVNHALVNPRHFLLLNDNVFAIDDGPVVSYVCAACDALERQRRADAGGCAVAALDSASITSASAGGAASAASAASPTSGPSVPGSVGSPAPCAHCSWQWPGDALDNARGDVRDGPARASLCSSHPTSTAVCLPTARSALPAPEVLTPLQRVSDDLHTALLFRSPLPAAPLEASAVHADAPPPLPVQSTHALSCLFSAHSLPDDQRSTDDKDTNANAATAALASARMSAVTRAYWSLCASSPAVHTHTHTPTLFHTPHPQPALQDADIHAAACVPIAGQPLAASPAAPSTTSDFVPPPPSLRAGTRAVADASARCDASSRRGSVEHSVHAPVRVPEGAAVGKSETVQLAPTEPLAVIADGESPPVRRRRGSSVYTFPLTPPAQRGAQRSGHARTRSDVPLLALGGWREGREGKRSSKAEPPVFRACTCGACGLCATVYCSVYGLSGACGRCVRCLGYNSK